MSIRRLATVVSCIVAFGCGASASKPVKSVNVPALNTKTAPQEWDVRTDAEVNVQHIAEGALRAEREDILHGPMHATAFIAFAEQALANGEVRGDACRWLISHARVLHNTLGLEIEGVPFRLAPDEEFRLLTLKLRSLESCKRIPS